LQNVHAVESDTKRGVRALLQRQILGKGDGAPGITTVMVDALNIVQDRIARSRLAGDPPDAVISPRLQNVGLFDFHRAQEAIDAGAHAVERQLDEIVHEIKACGPRRGHAPEQAVKVDGELQPVAK
jgi:NTE family protein